MLLTHVLLVSSAAVIAGGQGLVFDSNTTTFRAQNCDKNNWGEQLLACCLLSAQIPHHYSAHTVMLATTALASCQGKGATVVPTLQPTCQH